MASTTEWRLPGPGRADAPAPAADELSCIAPVEVEGVFEIA
jgi:hypothetical protein